MINEEVKGSLISHQVDLNLNSAELETTDMLGYKDA